MNLLRRGGTKFHVAAASKSCRQFHEKWSNPMRRILPFTFGVLVGTIVATAWAQYPTGQSAGVLAAASSMNPLEMMTNAQALPVQHHDAI
jgi:hypothetical protein